VAIKEIIQKSDIPPLILERQVLVLRRLAEAAHVVKLFDVYEDNYKVWLIFEFIPGGDLLKKLTEKSNFEEKEVKHMIQSITSAAAFCHKNNILHWNIKVESIFCGKNFLGMFFGSFGRAMILEPGQTVSDWTTPPSYKAPEHIQRKPYSYPSDCWALGVLAYIL